MASLRVRLWLSYALLIGIALTVVAAALFVFLLTNPLVYRQTTQSMNQVKNVLIDRSEDWSDLTAPQLVRWLMRLEQAHLMQGTKVRMLVFNRRRELIADSQVDAFTLGLPRLPRARPNGILMDAGGNRWLYTLKEFNNGTWLMVAALRPKVPVGAIFNDEFFSPILYAGILASLFSLVLAYAVARWIADPLQRLVATSNQAPDVNFATLNVGGPREVQELVRAYKDMLGRVQASQQAQRDFVANVSHEMKTPLTSIQGFAQALLDGTAQTPGDKQRAAEVIYNEAGRMHRMVVNLLDLARLDAGTAGFTFEPVVLNALMQTVGEKLALQANQAGVALQVQETELPLIPGDGDRLVQVLTNLVDNALRHTPRGGQVTLSACSASDGICVNVIDTGVGISSEALPHIFERFYRSDPARSAGQEPSAGLGLAIAQEIALAHGGQITVKSKPGSGSTFTLYLPFAQSKTSQPLSRSQKKGNISPN